MTSAICLELLGWDGQDFSQDVCSITTELLAAADYDDYYNYDGSTQVNSM